MATVTSSRVMHPVPLSQAAGGLAGGAPSLLQTFQAHVEDMRNLVLCKICIRPLYEPYTLGCGHTYCYSCLTSWFGGAPNRRNRKNCPDCRANVSLQPSPNYLLRDLVHMFISRVELLPEDETTAEHDEAMRIEAQLIESDRMTSTDGEPGLFKGAFCQSGNRYAGPIRDEEDGVLRCPRCAWEMEDGECGQCGYEDGEGDFSDEEDHEGDTVDSGSVISIPSSAIDADDAAAPPPFVNPFLFAQSRTTNDDFREWMRRDQEARHARRAARRMERRARRERAHTADTEETTSTMMERHRHGAYDVASEHEEEMAGFLERHPYNDHWNPGTSEPGDEDEEMTSAVDDDDRESTTSFHRAAILARDQGLHPPFESDLSSNGSETGGEVETATNGNSSEDSTESDDDSDTPEPGPTFQRLASRPARVVIDSDDDSSSDSSSSGEEEDEDHGNHVEDDEEESDDSSEGDSTPSPPRPAAVRQARVQMHRNRNRGGRGGGRGRGRGRPRMRN